MKPAELFQSRGLTCRACVSVSRLAKQRNVPRAMVATLRHATDECAICGVDKPGGRGGWHLDHDHETGALRGALCWRCNSGLGKMKDSPDVLAKALRYLREHGKALTTEGMIALLGPLERKLKCTS